VSTMYLIASMGEGMEFLVGSGGAEFGG
jgi:hypothetical protein